MMVECFAAPLILASYFACKRFGPVPLIVVSTVLFGLAFVGPYVHLLGGATNLGPLYAFITGVLLHFAAANRYRARHVVLSATMAMAVLVVCGTRKQTPLLNLGESLAAGALIFFIATNSTQQALCSAGSASGSFRWPNILQLLPPPCDRTIFSSTV
jgi:exopolysaccharide production protein ExoZ